VGAWRDTKNSFRGSYIVKWLWNTALQGYCYHSNYVIARYTASQHGWHWRPVTTTEMCVCVGQDSWYCAQDSNPVMGDTLTVTMMKALGGRYQSALTHSQAAGPFIDPSQTPLQSLNLRSKVTRYSDYLSESSVSTAWTCRPTDIHNNNNNNSKWTKPTDALKFDFIGITTLHVSGSLSAHHQEFLAVHRLWHILWSCDYRLLLGVGCVPSSQLAQAIFEPNIFPYKYPNISQT